MRSQKKILSIQIPEKSGASDFVRFLESLKLQNSIIGCQSRHNKTSFSWIKIKDLKTFTGLKERLTTKKFNFKDLTKMIFQMII